MKFSKCTPYLIVLLGATFGLAPRLAAMGSDDAGKTGMAVAAVDADVPNSPSAAPSSAQAPANGADPETSIRYGFEERSRFEGYNNAD
jgi:hypothetical protein